MYKRQFIDSLQIFSLLANVADGKSLVIHPATTTHSQLTDEELADQGIGRNTIRLSIGTEHIDDIIAVSYTHLVGEPIYVPPSANPAYVAPKSSTPRADKSEI